MRTAPIFSFYQEDSFNIGKLSYNAITKTLPIKYFMALFVAYIFSKIILRALTREKVCELIHVPRNLMYSVCSSAELMHRI